MRKHTHPITEWYQDQSLYKDLDKPATYILEGVKIGLKCSHGVSSAVTSLSLLLCYSFVEYK